MYSFYLFLISSASARLLLFMSFSVPIFGQNDPMVSPVSLRRSLVFSPLFFSYGFIHWSLKKASLSLCAVLWKSVFSWIYLSLSPLLFTSLLPFAIVSPPQITTSPSCFSFSLEWFCLLPPIQYYRPPSIVLHAQCLQSSNPLNLLSWWWTGRPGVLQCMRLQRIGQNWVTELNWCIKS